jgi:hypothetical protein
VFTSSVRGRAVRVGVVVLSLTGLVAVSACSLGSSEGSSASSAGKAAANGSPGSAASPAPSPSPSSGHTMPMGDTAAGQDKGAVAGIRLQSLVAQHSVLVADMMRARISRAPDVTQAVDAALGKNTQALATLVDNLFGTAAGQQFTDLWSGHIRYFYTYADALASEDAGALESARDGLAIAEVKMGDFFAGASAGRLPKATARAAVTAHIDHLLHQADAFAKRQYTVAGADYVMAYEHGYGMGGALAATLLPKTLATQLEQPQWKLRTGMTNLLGEHVALVLAAMRAANGDAADFQALAEGLNGNTTKLASAVESLFGGAASDKFQSMWADHVDALMAFTSSTVKDDDAGARAAQARLRAFEPALAGFLATATKSELSAQALAHAYNEHDQMLTEELTAYEAQDYNQAHQLSYQAYTQMFDVAGQLSNAIGVTLGANLPKGGTQTGGGGTAAKVGRH